MLSQKIAHACQKLKALQYEAAKVEFIINNTKTKEMRIGTPSNTGNILWKDLGSIVTTI